jgi:hypothetical protein
VVLRGHRACVRLSTSKTSRLTLRRLIAGIFAAVLIECRVGQCVSAVTVAGDYFERPFGVRVSGVRAAHLLQWVAGIIRRCADRIMPHSCVCSR